MVRLIVVILVAVAAIPLLVEQTLRLATLWKNVWFTSLHAIQMTRL